MSPAYHLGPARFPTIRTNPVNMEHRRNGHCAGQARHKPKAQACVPNLELCPCLRAVDGVAAAEECVMALERSEHQIRAAQSESTVRRAQLPVLHPVRRERRDARPRDELSSRTTRHPRAAAIAASSRSPSRPLPLQPAAAQSLWSRVSRGRGSSCERQCERRRQQRRAKRSICMRAPHSWPRICSRSSGGVAIGTSTRSAVFDRNR